MSNYSDLFPFPLTTEQDAAVFDIFKFLESDEQVFILKGHAGTGKTSLIQGVINHLHNKDTPFVLLASTGRASKVLELKTRADSATIHRHIYKLKVDETNNEIRRIFFVLRGNNSHTNTVYIVDESSMISDHTSGKEFLNFGTGRLLTDLFNYISGRKIIFVGDPAQLPPINCNISPALSKSEIQKRFNIEPPEAKLKQVMRYKSDSGIFNAAVELRNVIESANFGELLIHCRRYPDIQILYNMRAMVEAYSKIIKLHGYEKAIFITYSNAAANAVNQQVRTLLYPGKAELQKGESLVVMSNNYLFNLANGDHLTVEWIAPESHFKAGLHFRDVKVKYGIDPLYTIFDCKIIDDLLYSFQPNLSLEQENTLFKDFAIRMSNAGIKPNDDRFIKELLSDPFLNALKVKFGYGITCHKSQGGEWDDVFIQLENCFFNYNDPETQHRWAYTAITRSRRMLNFLFNPCLR